MFSKDNKSRPFTQISHSSHIKKESLNSYNEVSFNVLENAADVKTNEGDTANRDYSNRTIISSDELLNRNFSRKKKVTTHIKESQKNKKKYKSSKGRTLMVVFTLIVIMLIVVAAGFIVKCLDKNSDNSSDSAIKVAINDIAQADETLVKLNVFLEDSIDEHKVKESSLDKEAFEKTKVELDDLTNRFNELEQSADKSTEGYAMIDYAKQTIQARTKMLEKGIVIYENAVKSVDLIDLTNTFWEETVRADEELKESDNLIQSNDAHDYNEALEKSKKALDDLSQALENINELKEKNTKFDFDGYEKFVKLRKEAAEHSVKSCQALIEENLELAAKENSEYINKSNEASNAALNIGTTPVQTIRTKYYLETKPTIEEFKSSRKRAAELDLILRNYLENSNN